MRSRFNFRPIVLVGIFIPLISYAQGSASRVSRGLSKEEILNHSPVKGGLLVHLGPKSAQLLLEFSKETRFVCQGLFQSTLLSLFLIVALSVQKTRLAINRLLLDYCH